MVTRARHYRPADNLTRTEHIQDWLLVVRCSWSVVPPSDQRTHEPTSNELRENEFGLSVMSL
jgi:hypothetical protein